MLGWVLVVTAVGFVGGSAVVRLRDYRTDWLVTRLDDVPVEPMLVRDSPFVGALEPTDTGAPTAFVCVTSSPGFGRHLVAAVCRMFPGHFTNYIFVSAAVPESGLSGSNGDLGTRKKTVERDLREYVAWARARNLRAGYRNGSGADLVPAIREQCGRLADEYPLGVAIIGMPILPERMPRRSHIFRVAEDLERALRFDHIDTIVVPVSVPGPSA